MPSFRPKLEGALPKSLAPSPSPRVCPDSLPLAPPAPALARLVEMAREKVAFLQDMISPETVEDLGLEPWHDPGQPSLPASHAYDRRNPEHARAWSALRLRKYGIPNGPTHFRLLKAGLEAKFLRNAMKAIKADVQKHPERPYNGEYGVLGDSRGQATLRYRKGCQVGFSRLEMQYSSFNLHTHPPFAEPFTSSGSGADHVLSANAQLQRTYGKNRTYVTNGKDILQINAHDLGLQLLSADELSRPLPVAYQLPPPPSRRHSALF